MTDSYCTKDVAIKQLIFIAGVIAMLAAGFTCASGSPVLEIGGKIAVLPNASKVYTLSADQFMALPQSSIATATT